MAEVTDTIISDTAEPVIPADLIPPPVAETGPALTAPELPPSGDYGFPVPVITELEEGLYYLQLAASHNSDAVKEELAKIGGYWPLKVQVNERDSYPYRILMPGEPGGKPGPAAEV
jgi:hypothetical protein